MTLMSQRVYGQRGSGEMEEGVSDFRKKVNTRLGKESWGCHVHVPVHVHVHVEERIRR